MPSGEDSDTANDYPQRCERARKQTLSNNTAPQEDISISHGFRPALPKHTLDFHFLKAHLYPPFKGLEQLCSQQTIQHCLLLQRGTAIRAVTLKSAEISGKSHFPVPGACNALCTARRQKDKASLSSLVGGDALSPRRCHQQTTYIQLLAKKLGILLEAA